MAQLESNLHIPIGLLVIEMLRNVFYSYSLVKNENKQRLGCNSLICGNLTG